MNQSIAIAYSQADTKITVRMLMLVKMILVIPFGVTAASLVLYMTHQLHLSDFTAISVTAAFLGTTGLLRIIAGWLTDHYLSHRHMLLLSALFMFFGCALTAIPQSIYLGITSIAIGSAFTIAVNCLLTDMFQQDDMKRESAFLHNYSVMNIGFMISFFISGYYELHYKYKLLFMVSSGFGFLALLMVIFSWRMLTVQDNNIHSNNLNKILSGFILVLIMFTGLYGFIKIASTGQQYYQIFSLILAISFVAYSINKMSAKRTNNVFTYFIFIFPALLFSTIHYLMPMVLTLFIERNVDRQYFGLMVPPQWVQLFGNSAIVIGGPLLSDLFNKLRKHGVNISTSLQFSVALILIGASLLTITAGVLLTDKGSLVNFNWVMISNILQGIAELFIAPIGFAMIAKIAPSCSRGTMMGIWLLLLSTGAIFAGYISNMISNISLSFLFLGGFSVIAGLVIFLFRSKQI